MNTHCERCEYDALDHDHDALADICDSCQDWPTPASIEREHAELVHPDGEPCPDGCGGF